MAASDNIYRRGAAVFRHLGRAKAGTAALEAALVTPALALLLLNTIDYSRLIWARMEVENAAQIGAQAAYRLCSAYMPQVFSPPATATTACNSYNLSGTVTAAIQSTSLGSAVTLSPSTQLSAANHSAENYYCTVSGSLVSAGASPPSAMPANCSGAVGGSSANEPGDYITVTVAYSYSPLFAGLSFPPAQTLTASGMQRLE
jgi:Flp pilus assembly protein TadG